MNATEQLRVQKLQARIIDLRDRLKAAKARKLTASSRRVTGAMIASASNGNGKTGGSRRRKPAANLKGTRARARPRSAGRGAATATA